MVENYKSVLFSFCLSTKDDDCDFPSMYWIPKVHKNPYKQHYIAGSAKSTTKPLSTLFTSMLKAVKECLQSYHKTCFSRSGFNLMRILKSSKDLLETLYSRLSSVYNSKNTYEFSTLHTSIPYTM